LIGFLKALFNFKTVGSRTDSRLPFFRRQKRKQKDFSLFSVAGMGAPASMIGSRRWSATG
jgi:hypothetical protein